MLEFDENLPDLVKACENIQLQAKTFDENDNETGKAVKWETDNGDIDQNGLFAPQQADPATITASYSDEISDRIELQIEPGDLHHIQIVEEGIPYQMKCGSEYEFKVMSYDACNNEIEIILNTDIEWNLTGDIGKIDQSGKLTATEDVVSSATGGAGKVIADYNGMEDDTDKLTNIIPDDPDRAEIVEGYPKTMEAGETYDEFKVNVYDQYNNKIDGIYQVDDLDWDGGEIGTFEDNVFTAEKAVEGKITATLIQNPEIESQSTVEVTPGPPVKIVVTEDYPSTAMQCGDTHSFQFSAYDKYDNKVDDVSNDDVSWEVTDKTKGTINDSGKLTVVHPGLTKVTATLRDSGVGDTTDSVINIIVDGIETLKITEDYPKQMTAGETHEFHFKAYDAFDNEIVDIPDNDINWQPVDVSIGTFDGNVFTAEKIGVTYIQAKYKNNAIQDVTNGTIEILAGDIDEITVEAENAKLVADGESKSKITIIVKDAYDNPVKNETVTVSISGVGGRLSAEELTTSADGTCTTNYIAGGREGQVEITARLKSEAGKSDSVEIELTPFIPPSPIKVELLPHSRIIAPALNNDTYSMLKIRFTRTSLDLSTELHIYSLSGRPVYESFDRHERSDKPGWLEYIWDGRKDNQIVEDGIYIYVLKIGKQIKKGTFVVVR